VFAHSGEPVTQRTIVNCDVFAGMLTLDSISGSRDACSSGWQSRARSHAILHEHLFRLEPLAHWNDNVFLRIVHAAQNYWRTRMTKALQKIGLTAITAVGLAVGTAGVANADWDNGWHRGWHRGWHHGWRSHYAYGGDCFVRRTVHINRWGERIVRSVRVCR
jgi:hypothetical protein